MEGDTIHKNSNSLPRKIAGVVGETKKLNFRPAEFGETVGHQSKGDQDRARDASVVLRPHRMGTQGKEADHHWMQWVNCDAQSWRAQLASRVSPPAAAFQDSSYHVLLGSMN